MERRRGREWWLERVIEQLVSGRSLVEFCRRDRLSIPTFCGWLPKLAAKAELATARLLPVDFEMERLPFVLLQLFKGSGNRIGFSLPLSRCRNCPPFGIVFAWFCR